MIVRRIVHQQVPPKVEYYWTDWDSACPASMRCSNGQDSARAKRLPHKDRSCSRERMDAVEVLLAGDIATGRDALTLDRLKRTREVGEYRRPRLRQSAPAGPIGGRLPIQGWGLKGSTAASKYLIQVGSEQPEVRPGVL